MTSSHQAKDANSVQYLCVTQFQCKFVGNWVPWAMATLVWGWESSNVWELITRKQRLIMMGLFSLSPFVQTYYLSPKIKINKNAVIDPQFHNQQTMFPFILENGHITLLNALRSCFFPESLCAFSRSAIFQPMLFRKMCLYLQKHTYT